MNTKIQALIADLGVNENLWREAIKTLANLTNRTETSTHKSMPLKVFLHEYNRNDDNYS